MKKILIIAVLLFVIVVGINAIKLHFQKENGQDQGALARQSIKPQHGSPDAASPLPPAPTLNPNCVARPQFHYGKDDEQTTGTVYFLKNKEGKRYLVTAAHLYKDHEWASLRKISLSNMLGKPMGSIQGKPLALGKYTEDSPESNALLPDLREDIMIASAPGELSVSDLKLAAAPAVTKDYMWVVGCEVKADTGQKLFLCQVRGVSDMMITYQSLVKFDPDDFSGAPLVNQHGEVIGMMIGGNDKFYMATPAQGIRQMAQKAGIELE